MSESQFDLSSLWLSTPVMETNNKRLITKINYLKDNNLIVETPPLKVTNVQLIFEEGNTQKILLRTKLISENDAFTRIIEAIDKKVKQESTFAKMGRFISSCNYYGEFSFFIPIYKNEVNVLVNRENEVLSLNSLHRSSECRIVLLLSHVESVNEVFFLIWNVIQVKLCSQ